MEQARFIGLGILNLENLDISTKKFSVVNEYSPMAKEYKKVFNNRKKTVDHFYLGLVCGGSAELFNINFEGEETWCTAKGDEICKFVCEPKIEINSKLKVLKGIRKKYNYINLMTPDTKNMKMKLNRI